jgi:glycosyltransferase involved in cell wall biosynthesis
VQTFSIVTPVRNGALHVAETIESIVFQKGAFALQYILVDGGSTDETLTIAEDYRSLCESRPALCPEGGVDFSIVSEPDGGMYDALAKGLRQARGDYLAYLNASDRFFPGALDAVAAVFRDRADVHWLTGWNATISESGTVFDARLPCCYKREYIRSYVYGTSLEHIQQESTFWRSELMALVDLEKLTTFERAGDFYLWHCFAGSHQLHIVSALLGAFRMHANQNSENIAAYDDEIHRHFGDEISNAWRPGVQLHRLMWALPNQWRRRLNRDIIVPVVKS